MSGLLAGREHCGTSSFEDGAIVVGVFREDAHGIARVREGCSGRKTPDLDAQLGWEVPEGVESSGRHGVDRKVLVGWSVAAGGIWIWMWRCKTFVGGAVVLGFKGGSGRLENVVCSIQNNF